jgi:hypothetical protein
MLTPDAGDCPEGVRKSQAVFYASAFFQSDGVLSLAFLDGEDMSYFLANLVEVATECIDDSTAKRVVALVKTEKI